MFEVVEGLLQRPQLLLDLELPLAHTYVVVVVVAVVVVFVVVVDDVVVVVAVLLPHSLSILNCPTQTLLLFIIYSSMNLECWYSVTNFQLPIGTTYFEYLSPGNFQHGSFSHLRTQKGFKGQAVNYEQ
jgi:hypothetical protein